MWRAFFFAIGATLILLGAQCLVLDHIVVANGTRVPGFVAKYLDKTNQSFGRSVNPSFAPGANQNPNLIQQVASNLPGALQQGPGGQSLPRPSALGGSRFGPSRFADSQFSNTDLPSNAGYYGGVPFSKRQSPERFANARSGGPNSNFSLAGYGGNTGSGSRGQFGGVDSVQRNRLAPVTLGQGGSRLFRPSEWMPWGLLAIGTLVVLYTNSTKRAKD